MVIFQCFHGCLHYRIKKVISEHFFLRDASMILALSKGKSHMATFCIFPPTIPLFFVQKKVLEPADTSR